MVCLKKHDTIANSKEIDMYIQNKGVTSVESFTMLGASAKVAKIGQFGSGNKFAIATLLRKKVDFKIYLGLREVEVTTRPVQINGNEFYEVVIDGQGTNFVTEFGHVDWTVDMAIREFVSNAIDEGSFSCDPPREGHTTIWIDHNFDLNKWVTNEDGCFDGCGRVYRKGILVAELNGMFNYNFNDIKIDESRNVPLEVAYSKIRNFEGYSVSQCESVLHAWRDPDVSREIVEFHLHYSGRQWADAFWNIYGKDTQATPELVPHGFLTYNTMVKTRPSEYDKVTTVSMPGHIQSVADDVWAFLPKESRKNRPQLIAFEGPLNSFYIDDDCVIGINKNMEIEKLPKTIMLRYIQYLTGTNGDYQSLTTKYLLDMVCKTFTEKLNV